MSMLPKQHLCTKCGKFHPVICDDAPFWGRVAKEADIARLTADNARLRSALTRIAEYETDWATSVAENVNTLQAMAEAALTPQDSGK